MDGKELTLSIKVVVRDDRGRCLLLKRSMKSKGHPGWWDLPGGKVDLGESFDAALVREVREETQLSIRVGRLLGATEAEAPLKRIIYLVMEAHAEAGQIRLSDEHDAFIWVDAHEAARIQADICEPFRPFVCEKPGAGAKV
jgi:8-oxo-dGTP diphosphatase